MIDAPRRPAPSRSRRVHRRIAGGLALVVGLTAVGIPAAQAFEPLGDMTVGQRANYLAVHPDGRTAYVVNEDDDTMTVVDVTSGSTITTVGLSNAPFGIGIAPDGSYGVVTHWDGGSTVQLFDTTGNALVGTPITVGSGPFDVAFTSDGSEIWVTNYFSSTISVIDAASRTVLQTITTGLSFPEGITLSPDGATMWVANVNGDISSFDASTRALIDTGSGSGFYQDIVFSPDGSRGYVLDNSEAAVDIFDTSDPSAISFIDSIAVPATPVAIAMSVDATKLYVSVDVDVDPDDGIAIVTLANESVELVQGFSQVRGIVALPDGNGVLVTSISGGVVTWAGDPSFRVAGIDRYNTAVKISQQAYPAGAPIVYVATGTDYPDALAAGPAAAAQGGPLLLTANTSLPAAVKAEVQRLNPSSIIIVGGTNRVSDGVKAELETIAPVTRITGTNRYETSRLIALDAFGVGGASDVYIATGLNFPDALTAGAAGATWGLPVILVNGTAPDLDAATLDALNQLGVINVAVVGGPNMVSDGILQDLVDNFGAGTVRLTGTNRYETGLVINSSIFSSSKRALIATGLIFPDALAASAWAGRIKAPLYIVPTTCVPQGIIDHMTTLGVQQVTLVGGPDRLTQSVADLTPC